MRRGYVPQPGRTLTVLGLVIALVLLGSAGTALAGPGNGNPGNGNPGNGKGTSAQAGPSNGAGGGAASKRSEARQGPRGTSGSARGHSGPPRGSNGKQGKTGGSFQASAQGTSTDGGQAQGKQRSSGPKRQGAGPSGRSGPPAHAQGAQGSAGGDGPDRAHPHAGDEVLSGGIDDGRTDDAGGGSGPADGDDAPFAVGTADGAVASAPPAGGITTAGAGGQPTTEVTELAGVVTPEAAPEDGGETAATGTHPRMLDRLSRGTSRALDTVLSPTRDFGVPALLVAILLVYLALQRRLDRGALPMSSLASPSDGNQAHVRFEL